MSAPVHRRHREAALVAHGVLPLHFHSWSTWLDAGGVIYDDTDTHCMVEENASAQAIADAEAHGREVERALIVAFARSLAERVRATRSELAKHSTAGAIAALLDLADSIEGGRHAGGRT